MDFDIFINVSGGLGRPSRTVARRGLRFGSSIGFGGAGNDQVRAAPSGGLGAVGFEGMVEEGIPI